MAAPGGTDADTPEDAVVHNHTTEVLAEDAATLNLPAGFDADSFVRQAKVNFIRLQAANDEGNLDDLREFTTPEVYAELKIDIDARKGAAQKTEVIDLEAAIVDYAEEANRWVVSVRYTGRLYEDAGVVTSELDEVWHLVKPRKGNAGWLVAGIQQLN
jgi:predicted lipid-binding transport protein (Tim44 family)